MSSPTNENGRMVPIPENSSFHASQANMEQSSKQPYNSSTRSVPKQLSTISSAYDVGGKGYLTPAEKRMRSMDTDNRGELSIDQVAEIVKQTMQETNKNKRLRLWVAAFVGAAIILALSNLGTAFLAAYYAKQTDVNESSGRMTVRGKDDLSVITVSAGRGYAFRLEYDETTGKRYVCMGVSELATIFDSTLTGTANSLLIEDAENSTFTFGLRSGGSAYNDSHACVGTSRTGNPLCTDFGDICSRNSANRKLSQISPEEKAAHFRHLVQQKRMQSILQVHGVDDERRAIYENEMRRLQFGRPIIEFPDPGDDDGGPEIGVGDV